MNWYLLLEGVDYVYYCFVFYLFPHYFLIDVYYLSYKRNYQVI